MGDTLKISNSSKNPKSSNLIAGKKAYNKSLVASRPRGFGRKNHEQLVSLIHGGFGSSTVGHITFFLVKVAALEAVRRFTKSRCPAVWRGLQALQIFCYPPFKWIQKWALFKGLVKSMQALSRPLLVLSIATAFSDQTECSDGTSDCHMDSPDSELYSESSSIQTNTNTSHSETAPRILESENWLVQLYKELENQGISLPERVHENELRRFYTASNNDFSSFLASIKKTIRWRETYRILSAEELEIWSNLVFWHGSDVMHRPCLIVRLGVACSTLLSQDRPRFAQAVISQVEYGVLHLVDADNPQISVLVDCEGLSPLRIPMQMMRSCSSSLQDHFPNLLGCLLVIRLPAVVRVIAQTFIQVLKPATRKKLKIEGEMYQKVLNDHLATLPSYLGGCCTCMKCSKFGTWDMRQLRATGTSSRSDGDEADGSDDNEDSEPLHPSFEFGGHPHSNYDHFLRTAIISVLIFWVFMAFSAGMYDLGSLRLSS
ncbi:sec14 cytosolic factor [Senna tora]|uniref:Sec14 cytosolic factor n=1 Tax=Senna tora TaxID=362788 RepID=A0A834TLJ3_9FABA|nr:sec14 cytosolic factor [Senna tora]